MSKEPFARRPREKKQKGGRRGRFRRPRERRGERTTTRKCLLDGEKKRNAKGGARKVERGPLL